MDEKRFKLIPAGWHFPPANQLTLFLHLEDTALDVLEKRMGHSNSMIHAARPVSKLLGIEIMRGLLALSVVIYHYYYYGPITNKVNAEVPSHYMAFLRFAVSAFFIISGYVIAFSAESGRWQSFAISRFARLFPAIAVCATITFVVLHLGGSPKSVKSWLGSALLLPLVARPPLIDASYWSIIFELHFYGIVFFLLLVGQASRALEVLTVLGVVAFGLHFIQPSLGGLGRILFPHTPLFALGIAFYRIRTTSMSFAVAAMFSINFVLAARGAHINFFRVDMFDGVRSGLETGFYIILVCCGLFIISERLRVPAILARTATLLGGISYPLYLIHQDVGYVLIRVFSENLPLEASRILTIATVILLSIVIFVFFEKPGGEILKRKLNDLAVR